MDPDEIVSLPLLPVSVVSLVVQSLSTSPQAILRESCSICSVVLVCLWEDVSSGSSYSAVLATLPSDLLIACDCVS